MGRRLLPECPPSVSTGVGGMSTRSSTVIVTVVSRKRHSLANRIWTNSGGVVDKGLVGFNGATYAPHLGSL